jgi:hypothetical protein
MDCFSKTWNAEKLQPVLKPVSREDVLAFVSQYKVLLLPEFFFKE